MDFKHKNLAEGRWFEFSLPAQMGNIGSEVNRAWRWQGKDEKLFQGAVERTLELFELTLSDKRWKGRLKEIARAREVFLDAALFRGREYRTDLKDLTRYFDEFALAAARKI